MTVEKPNSSLLLPKVLCATAASLVPLLEDAMEVQLPDPETMWGDDQVSPKLIEVYTLSIKYNIYQ